MKTSSIRSLQMSVGLIWCEMLLLGSFGLSKNLAKQHRKKPSSNISFAAVILQLWLEMTSLLTSHNSTMQINGQSSTLK